MTGVQFIARFFSCTIVHFFYRYHQVFKQLITIEGIFKQYIFVCNFFNVQNLFYLMLNDAIQEEMSIISKNKKINYFYLQNGNMFNSFEFKNNLATKLVIQNFWVGKNFRLNKLKISISSENQKTKNFLSYMRQLNFDSNVFNNELIYLSKQQQQQIILEKQFDHFYSTQVDYKQNSFICIYRQFNGFSSHILIQFNKQG
ncbi:hypothetical protein pb186bvf_011213 [Paramecium bursaria]